MKKHIIILIAAFMPLLLHGGTPTSGLPSLSSLAADDIFAIVDKSDTTASSNGTDKRVSVATLASALGSADFMNALDGKDITNSTFLGGSVTELTALSLRSTGAAFDLNLAIEEALTGDKTLKFIVNDGNRTINLAGDATFGGAFATQGAVTFTGAHSFTATLSADSSIALNGAVSFAGAATFAGTFTTGGAVTFSGAHTLTLTISADTALTFPTTGTLATLSGAETLTGKLMSGADNTFSNIGNAALTNSSITIAGTATPLGGSITAAAILQSMGSTQGSILYRNASGWTVLTPGLAGQALTSGGPGADVSWVTPGLPRSYLAGLTLSNNVTDAVNDIDVAPGSARGSANAADLVLGSSITKRLDAAWAVGTNQGGLDAGAIADGTYHVWLIKRSDTGVVDVLFSTSASSPTMPTNYDIKRRIGSIIRISGAIMAFTQAGDNFGYTGNAALDVDDAALTTARSTYTFSRVPTGVRMEALLWTRAVHATAGTVCAVMDLSVPDEAISLAGTPLFTHYIPGNGFSAVAYLRIPTNASAQICARSSASSTTMKIRVLGWIDRRGRDD